MSVTVPPAPPELHDDRDLDERIAELDALIEEARRRARRRRRLYGCVIAAAVAAGAAAYGWGSTLGRSEADASPTGDPPQAGSARSTPAQTRSTIAFMRHGPQVAEGVFTSELYVVSPDGSGMRRLTANAWNVPPPAWSPDGRTLAFERRLDPTRYGGQCGTACNVEIFVINGDGSGQRNLTRNRAYDGAPAWSPDGRRIAFVSYRHGRTLFRKADIYVMNADGSGQRRLTSDPLGDLAPAWSPDGQQIAFQSYRDGNWNIYAMNADGGDQRRLTRGRIQDITPAWSPDGRTILFTRSRNTTERRDSNVEIWAMNADGSGERNLTRNPAGDENPVWSPDGRKIGFVSHRDGRPEIYVMNADGSGQRNLTPGVRRLALGLAWSPGQTK